MKISLEEAIRKAEVRVDLDDCCVTVDRARFVPSCTQVGKYALDHINDDNANISYDGKFWRDKCAMLLSERNNIEAQLGQQLIEVQQKLDHLNTYANTLKKENERLSKKRTILESKVGDTEAAVEKIGIYELLSGTTIEGGNRGEYICTVKNASARKATRFTLQKTQHADGNILVHPKGNVRLLPEYLQEGDIVCEAAVVPVLLGDVLQILFKDDEKE